jgi:hypothetical protein
MSAPMTSESTQDAARAHGSSLQRLVRCKNDMNKNPIFIEYYPHEGCECYKVLNPWTKYAQEKIVLCTVKDGIGKATVEAGKVLMQKMADALSQPFAPNDEVSRGDDTATSQAR